MNPTIQILATIALVLFALACLFLAFRAKTKEERRMGWVGVALVLFFVMVNSVFKVEEALFITSF